MISVFFKLRPEPLPEMAPYCTLVLWCYISPKQTTVLGLAITSTIVERFW